MNEFYDYHEHVKGDIYDALEENFYGYFDGITAEDVKTDPYEVAGRIADDMFNSDSVTGNASGSYFCNTWKAKMAVLDNIDILRNAYIDWGYEANDVATDFLEERWEAMDVTIRCYLLHEVMDEVMEEIRDAIEGIEDEEMIQAYAIAERLAA